MEENVILSNIATIITKDIIIDELKSRNNGTTFIMLNKIKGNAWLLEPDDDEDCKFFQLQQRLLKKEDTKVISKKAVVKKRHKTLTKVNEKNVKLIKAKPRSYPLINLLNTYNVSLFEGHLHLSKLSFLNIFQLIKDVLCAKDFPLPIAMQTVFSISLWKLTTDEHFEVISNKFDIPMEDCQLVIRNFWHIISDNYERYIKWPNSHATQQLNLAGFRADAHLKVFQHLFGILALKCIDVFLDHVDGEVSVIIQIICNAEMKIIDCYVELTKNYNFEKSPIGQTLATNEETMPSGCFLLGDSNFPLNSYLMRPIDMPCFRKEHIYNQLLQPVFEKAQEVLDTMAKRFNILYALEAKDLNEVRKIVETVCALHNLCVDVEDDYVTRKREVVKFNWATEKKNIKLKHKTNNENDVKKRNDLIEAIVD